MKFVQRLAERRPLLLDGAMGTMLQASGLPAGVSPEEFCMERPDILQGIHKAYLDAGVDIITSCTFGGNPCKLPASLDVFTFNKRMVETARAAAAQAGRPVFVAGNVGPSGHFARPLGDMEPEELIKAFSEQIRGLVAGGADLIFIETQFDLAEARAAVTAARQVCDLPVMVSMTFEQGVSLTGSSPTIFAETMQNMGVAALGTNCSLGPDQMLPVVEELLSVCSCPVVAEPNAGLPELRGSETVFPLGPEAFAQKTAAFAARGARVLGGCCGTTPDFIRLLNGVFADCRPGRAAHAMPSVLCSPMDFVTVDGITVVGERINPTGKKRFQQALREGDMNYILEQAVSQSEAGAQVLDVNVGAPGVDEPAVMEQVVKALQSVVSLPLQLDSSHADALERGLRVYNGKPIVNSVNGETEVLERVLPLCKKYGAAVVGLAIDERGIQPSADARFAIAKRIVDAALAHGIPREDIYIDCLTLTASAQQEDVLATVEALARCKKELGVRTILGVSNISFGLPCRPYLNTAFLTMAMYAGLDLAIMNPSSEEMMAAVYAYNVLTNRDRQSAAYIARYADKVPASTALAQARTAQASQTADAPAEADAAHSGPFAALIFFTIPIYHWVARALDGDWARGDIQVGPAPVTARAQDVSASVDAGVATATTADPIAKEGDE